MDHSGHRNIPSVYSSTYLRKYGNNQSSKFSDSKIRIPTNMSMNLGTKLGFHSIGNPSKILTRRISASAKTFSEAQVSSATQAHDETKVPTVNVLQWRDDDSSRSEKLTIRNKAMRRSILEGIPKTGPYSLRLRTNRMKYSTPLGLNEIFEKSYDILKEDSQEYYKIAQEVAKEIETFLATHPIDQIKQDAKLTKRFLRLKERHVNNMVKAEINNPEVIYNYKSKNFDFSLPVYRYYAKKDWEEYGQMLIMQRLEQLHVIPDTLPTLNPKVEVSLQFPGFINKWIEPGEILSTSVSARPPIFKIQQFNNNYHLNDCKWGDKDQGQNLYTIIIVNPDTPNIEQNTFSTTLHYAAGNIPLTFTDTLVDYNKLADSTEMIQYLAPTPEKNAPTNRLAVWVFQQQKKIDFKKIENREFFNIRGYQKFHHLSAVGAHVWRNDWDRSTEEVRQKYGLPEGRVFHRVRR